MINTKSASRAEAKLQEANPFGLSVEDFRNLEDYRKNELLNIAKDLAEPFVKKFFLANPDKDWFVLAHSWECVIDSGDFSKYPTDQQQVKMSHDELVVVHVFARNTESTQ